MESRQKTVLITGAGGNVGQAAVRRFLDDGFRVVATVSPGKAGNFQPRENLTLVEVDLIREESAEKAVQDTCSKFGSVDAALITAGGWSGGSISSMSWEDVEKMVNLNFRTAFNIVRPVFLHMKEQASGGRIVLFGARAALVPPEGKRSFAYSLSKRMLFHFAEMLNAEGSAQNVITSVVVPGTIDTPQNREAMPDAEFSDWVPPEEFAKVMSFLCSDGAAALREPVLRLYGRSRVQCSPSSRDVL